MEQIDESIQQKPDLNLLSQKILKKKDYPANYPLKPETNIDIPRFIIKMRI